MTQNRREFLRTAARGALLLGVGALGGALWYRRRELPVCVNDSQCHGCGQFNGCGLPAAQATRQREKGQ